MEVDWEDEVCTLACGGENTCSVGSLVAWATVVVIQQHVFLYWQEVDDWHGEIQLPEGLINNGILLHIPPRPIEKQPINIHPIRWSSCQPLFLRRHNFEFEIERVYWYFVQSRVCLQDTSEETLREVETTHPIAYGILLVKPFSHELHSSEHVFEPRRKGFEGAVRYFLPVAGKDVVLEGEVHLVEVLGHDDDALDCFLEVGEGAGHRGQQVIEFLDFLE